MAFNEIESLIKEALSVNSSNDNLFRNTISKVIINRNLFYINL